MVCKTILVSAILGALGVQAAAIEKRQSTGLTDAQILNFALVLEHFENTFYSQAVSKFSASDFTNAGFPSNTYTQIQTIASDEAAHVAFLTSALTAAGATPVQRCNYTFPYTDVKGFVGLSQVLEGVGVSAYLGAAQYISNKNYLTAAAAVLTSEARHSAFIRYINGAVPFVVTDTPLTPTAVTSLAAPFFASCPNGSAPPFTPYPAANLTSTSATPGSTINIAFANSSSAGNATYCVFLSGLAQAVSPYRNGSCTLPSANISAGQVYGLVTKTPGFTSDADVLAGPVVLQIGRSTSNGSASADAATVAGAAVSTGAASKTQAVAGLSMAIVAIGSALLL